MIYDIWRSEDLAEGDIDHQCTLKALCIMNREALSNPDFCVGIVVSFSSVPLSYLLYRRNDNEGFLRYLDASVSGRMGLECTNLFKHCPTLD